MRQDKAVKQYLEGYAEPQIQAIRQFPTTDRWDKVVCIPAFNESDDFLIRLINHCEMLEQKVLLILSINQPENCDDCPLNTQLHTKATEGLIWQQGALTLSKQGALGILTIDQFSHQKQIPKKQGVGLARKTACDIAVYLMQSGHIASHHIFSTDADTQLPETYFDTTLNKNTSAGTFPFTHKHNQNQAITQATQYYEESLNAYVGGLKMAKSPYAYHTIGSCLLIDAKCYCQVRGFPKRSGAEDFYLLNKLNKIKPVVSLSAAALLIESRVSDRVPFGTGPAVEKLIQDKTSLTTLFYPDESYLHLKQWLNYLDYRSKSLNNHLERFACENQLSDKEKSRIQQLAGDFELDIFLTKLFNNFTKSHHRKREIHNWFDGFKTLKFIRQYTVKVPAPKKAQSKQY